MTKLPKEIDGILRIASALPIIHKLYVSLGLINNKKVIMTELSNCPKCNMDNTYFDGTINICPDCSYEWMPGEEASESEDIARDSNGATLADGDAVTVIKDLNVKGSSMVIKRGTKVKSIRLTDNPEEVDCKIDGSSIVLKTCFLKKS